MNVPFYIYKASAYPHLRVFLDYGDHVRLCEVKFHTGRFRSGKHRWRVTLLTPSSRVQRAVDCQNLIEAAELIDQHLCWWFGNSIGSTQLHVYLREVVRSEFERDEAYMKKHSLIF